MTTNENRIVNILWRLILKRIVSILFIPFIITPGILTLIAYLGTVSGFAPATYIAIPWTTPPIIGAFLATGATAASIRAAILAAINFIVAVLIYLPFVKLADRQRVKSK